MRPKTYYKNVIILPLNCKSQMHHVLNFHLMYIKWQNSKIQFLTLSSHFEKIWSIVCGTDLSMNFSEKFRGSNGFTIEIAKLLIRQNIFFNFPLCGTQNQVQRVQLNEWGILNLFQLPYSVWILNWQKGHHWMEYCWLNKLRFTLLIVRLEDKFSKPF